MVGFFAHQIVAEGPGSNDIRIVIQCRAGTTTDILPSLIFVNGWKQPDDVITVTIVE